MNELTNWLDNVLRQNVPEDVTAFCFNLYDDGDNNWSLELVGTGSFDVDDTDWPCYEVTDFGTRAQPFAWNKAQKWGRVLTDVVSVLRKYLKNGKYAHVLKSKSAVGVGFVDGDIEILFAK
ncbi:MAG: hypothetical protein GX900_07445 [Clostridiaceae bacterium]|nr:hypothetical protein [Clostridiaceae bacterium]